MQGPDADRGTIANITVAAPPITGPGTLATTWPTFCTRPSGISSTPHTLTTQRPRTLVRPTRPALSAKPVSGKAFMNPARAAGGPSVARPRARSAGVRLLSAISETASMTMHMEMIASASNVG